ncbi:MAG: hypothetical protein MUO33_06295 [Sedimentisphaerales bacterium]|nr:hypothetical protein [Sedimentisphaerales bacterium]
MEISTINYFDQVDLIVNADLCNVGPEYFSDPVDLLTDVNQGADVIISVAFQGPDAHCVNFQVFSSEDGLFYDNSPGIEFALPYSVTGRSLEMFVNGLAYFKIRCENTVPTEHNRVSIKARPWRYCDKGFMSGPMVRD